MRILLDSGVLSHAEFAQHAVKPTPIRWGHIRQTVPVHGFVRKAPDKNPEHRKHKEALFTVGRLIREARIEAYTYIEILFERMRGKGRFSLCDALEGCEIQSCSPALDRSKFMQTLDFVEMIWLC